MARDGTSLVTLLGNMNGHPAPDVVIVGAGVIGCATAYFLGKDHGLRALIIERDGVGSQASGAAAGELSPTLRAEETPSALLSFLHTGLDLHRSMASKLVEESGIDYRFTRTPIVRPALSADEVDPLREDLASWGNQTRSRWLDPEELAALGTVLTPETFGAVVSEHEYQLESYPFALALAAAAERFGATISSGVVTDVEIRGGRATGATVNGRVIPTDTVVLACGPWTADAAEWLDLPVPVIPLKGQIVHLQVDQPALRHAIFHSTGYVLPKPTGTVFIGTTQERVGFDPTPTAEARESIIQRVLRFAPSLHDARVTNHTACLRPLSLDGLPIVGGVPHVDGAYLATGHGTKGVLLSLVTGMHLANSIASSARNDALAAFDPSRLTSMT